MTRELDRSGFGNALFPCGHENSQGNHYCDVCGAARDGRTCPACNSPNREEAKFCGACGARLLDEGAARDAIVATAAGSHLLHSAAPPTRPTMARLAGDSVANEPPDLFGPRNLEESSPWSGRGRWRRDDRSLSSVEDGAEDGMPGEEDYLPAEPRRKRLFLPTVAAVIVVCAAFAIALAVKQFGATPYGGTLGRPASQPPAGPGSPRITGERSPDSMNTNPSAAPAAPSMPPGGAANPSAPETARTPAPPRAAQALAPSLLPPAQTPTEAPAEVSDQAPGKASQPAPASGRSETSEELMADFLVEQLGPAGAVDKALSNAAWYDASQSEHEYWQRVAETIRHRAGP